LNHQTTQKNPSRIKLYWLSKSTWQYFWNALTQL